MIHRVICHQMSGTDYEASNLRTHLHESSNQKKTRFDLMTRKYVEQSFGVDIVWSVVVGERQIARIRAAWQRDAKQLRARRIGVIGEISCRGDRACCELSNHPDILEKSEHKGHSG